MQYISLRVLRDWRSLMMALSYLKILEELVKIYKKVEKNVAITLAIHAIRPLLEKNPELRIPEILSVYKTPLYGK